MLSLFDDFFFLSANREINCILFFFSVFIERGVHVARENIIEVNDCRFSCEGKTCCFAVLISSGTDDVISTI